MKVSESDSGKSNSESCRFVIQSLPGQATFCMSAVADLATREKAFHIGSHV